MTVEVLQIALPLPLPGLFDYLPDSPAPADSGWIGCRVKLRFSGRALVGVVAGIGVASLPLQRLRAIEQRIDPQSPWPEELWRSLHWLAGYYHAPLGEVLALALPAGMRQGGELLAASPEGWIWQRSDGAPAPSLRPGSRPAALWQLLAGGALDETQLDLRLPDWRAAARSLRERGRLQRRPRPLDGWVGSPGFALNAEQQAAAAAVDPGAGFAALLLDGVTGSGKTEVYLDALERCLQRGQQALVLVPEIALTPQTVRRFRARLGDAVLTVHSGLSEGDRRRAWSALARGEPRVVVGTRSAVFSPLPRGGLIVVDEEHDASYKQQDGVRYSARDFALLRGRALAVPVLLGSATPSLESLAHAHSGRYRHLRLRQRAGLAKPPRVDVLDLRKQPLQAGLGCEARAAIAATLDAGGQVLVFRNRRGFAPALLCHDCGWTAQCPHCDRPLTVHRSGGRLICHHCGQQARPPSACPDCSGLALTPQGVGTERLEGALAEQFPHAPVIRIDRDTTRHRDAVAELLDRLGSTPGILVGTQMLAKGHDLSRLDLVVVVGIDEGLFSGDFRAGERLAQLLVQVAGRAGRGERPGRVLLQTHHPRHPLLVTLLNGGYPAYAEGALEERRIAGFPPFAYLALLRAEARDESDWRQFLLAARTLLADASAIAAPAAVEVLGPLPAPQPRRAGYSRGQLAISAARRSDLQQTLSRIDTALYALPEARRVRWSLDVDPLDLY